MSCTQCQADLPQMQGQTVSYYFDMTQKPIGNRPVLARRIDHRAEPKIMTCGKCVTKHNAARAFNCAQPCWKPNCM